MKATGIVRRIDELGRIVIPKEIRRALRIRESDPLEIYTDNDGGIVLKKYAKMQELSDYSRIYCQALNGTFGYTAAIADTEAIRVAVGGLKKQLMGRSLSRVFLDRMQEKKAVVPADDACMLFEDGPSFRQVCAVPIFAAGDFVGSVMLLSEDAQFAMSISELQALKAAALYLGKQLEE